MSNKIVFATVAMTGNPVRLATTHTPLLELHIESDTGNDLVQVGGSDVATNYGATVAAGPSNAKTFAQGPSGATAFDLSEVYLLGTDGNNVRIAYIRH